MAKNVTSKAGKSAVAVAAPVAAPVVAETVAPVQSNGAAKDRVLAVVKVEKSVLTKVKFICSLRPETTIPNYISDVLGKAIEADYLAAAKKVVG